MPDSPTTSVSLLERLQSDEPEAWRQTVELYGPVVYGWARRQGLAGEDAADVTQEVFLAVARSVGTFHRERHGAFRGWLWIVARSKWNDWRRRSAKQPAVARGGSTALQRFQSLPDPDEEAPPPTDAELQSFYRRAVGLIESRFDPQTWAAFWQTAVEGRSPDDVAAELGVSRWAVYKARSRVLQRLRTELAGLDEAS